MSSKFKIICPAAPLLVPAFLFGGVLQASAQDTIPVINDLSLAQAAQSVDSFVPLREQSSPALPPQAEPSAPLTAPPLPLSSTAPATDSIAFPAPAPQPSLAQNSYNAPITSLPSIADLVDTVSYTHLTLPTTPYV